MSGSAPVYPARDRTAWILAQRPPHPAPPDPDVPNGVFRERERLASGELADSGVVLLTNRECPWRCVMCDLWQHTTTEPVPEGAIARQVERAVRTWTESGPLPAQVKLYNSGSFFDPGAIPPADYAPVARQVAFARNVVVESHPTLIGDRTLAFRDLLNGSLEVAMGLETAHPEVLEKLNKKFDLSRFARAAEFLARERIALRVFLLVNPPFLLGATEAESHAAGVAWAVKSAQFAFDCGATAVTLIATRAGNGAMERLRDSGEWIPPMVHSLEAAHAAALDLRRGRVFADTWALEPSSTCPRCLPARRARLEAMNLTQQVPPAIRCAQCGR
ncbi:radical SAM protein [Opitutaceae bacterium EW11]|nr:radical SAM protein [Opitutaceae bacterium EW11]